MNKLILRVLNKKGVPQRELSVEHFPFSFGRVAENDAQIEDPTLSRKHASLELRDGVLYFVDHGSSNGSFDATGARITELRLDTGTHRLRLGYTWIDVIQSNAAPEGEATATVTPPSANPRARPALPKRDFVDLALVRLARPRRNALIATAIMALAYATLDAPLLNTLGLALLAAVLTVLRALVLGAVTWRVSRLRKRTAPFLTICSVYLVFLAGYHALEMFRQQAIFSWPEAGRIAATLSVIAALSLFAMILLNLRIILNLRGRAFALARLGLLVAGALNGILEFAYTGTNWTRYETEVSANNYPFRHPASAEITSAAFRKELDESLAEMEKPR